MKHRCSLLPALVMFIALGACSYGAPGSPQPPDLAPSFAGIDGTFVLLDGRTEQVLRHDASRARQRFLPASTFKIPNALIALEAGVASGADFTLHRDEAAAPSEPWWPDAWREPSHTLRTALRNSVVWYYQEIARRTGPERMRILVDRFDYGNEEISGGIDRFWLTGGLRISADEQIEFLRRFYFGELGVSERHTRTVKEMLVLEETAEYRLSGKTGWVGFGEQSWPQVGWLVGYVERGEEVHFFAMNIDMRQEEDAAARMAITRAVLREVGIIGR